MWVMLRWSSLLGGWSFGNKKSSCPCWPHKALEKGHSVRGVKRKSLVMEKIFFRWQSPQPVPPEVLFAFHENPANLRHVQPPGLRIEELQAAPQAVAGEGFRLVVRQLGLRLDWRGLWLRVEPPGLLVDTAPEGPLPFFAHHHCFLAPPPGNRSPGILRDEVYLELPQSIAWWPFVAVAVRLALVGMFHYRHAATRRYLRSLVRQVGWTPGDSAKTQRLLELARGCSIGGSSTSF